MSILLEQFETILKRQQREEIIPFLKVLNDAQKKELAPYIKSRSKELLDYRPTPNDWKLRATNKQMEILHLAAFVCLNQKDYTKINIQGRIFTDKLFLSVVTWYCPPWFNDYINKHSAKNFISDFYYDDCMALFQSGMLQPTAQLITQLLPMFPYESAGNKRVFKPEKALIYPQTLNEHIWYLFDVDCSIDSLGKQVDPTASDTLKNSWAIIFKQYSDEKKIDRSRLLRETLLATNKNLSKFASSWFADTFNYLLPSFEEIIALQKELFAILGSTYPKSVTNALQLIKTVAEEKDFDIPSFLDAVHVLLPSDSKSTVTTVLMVLEKLAQKNPEFRERIALAVCQVFIHSHDDLQKRAVKIIVKYGDKGNGALRNEIRSFQANLMVQVKESLTDFIDHDTIVVASEDVQPATVNYNQEAPLTAIPFPANIEDLIFFASQSFDGNEIWHIDILPAALIKFRSQLKAADVASLEPAFQRAFRLVKGTSGYSTNGLLDTLLSWFFIDAGNWMINKFPGAAKSNDIWNMIIGGGSYTKVWPEHLPYYGVHKTFMLEVVDRIRQENDLPLLSTPTHAPCWIDPAILIKRLLIYQESGQSPSDIDMQIAIARCYLHHPKEAWQLAVQALKGEFKSLITFLLDDKATPQGPFQHKTAWMIASLTRKDKKEWTEFESFGYYNNPFKNYTGDNIWDCKSVDYKENRYDYKLSIRVLETKTKKVLLVHPESNGVKPQSGLSKFMSKLFNKPVNKPEDVPMLYESLIWGDSNHLIDYTDVRRLLSLVPNNIEPILRDFIYKCLQQSKIDNEWDKKTVKGAIQFLYDTWHDPGKMSYLFMAICMLCNDRSIASLAGEIWIRNAGIGRIDNAKLGKILGELQSAEYAPFKRFTDLVMQQLFRISALHNRQLQLLIESLLAQLPADPLKGQKRLVEIHQELTASNK